MAKIKKKHSGKKKYVLKLNAAELEALYIGLSVDRSRYDTSEQLDTALRIDEVLESAYNNR